MKCSKCNKECVPRSSQVITLSENTFQTKREYKCPKCKKIYEIIDDPIRIVSEYG